MQTECKKPSLLEIFAEVQPILYKKRFKKKVDFELHKSLDDFNVADVNYLDFCVCQEVDAIC